MEELIYLAVVVGWFLLNAYKKSQEAKRKREAGSGQETFDDQRQEPAVDMEEMLRELIGVPKEPEVEPVPEPVRAPEPLKMPSPSRPSLMSVVQPTQKTVRPSAAIAAQAASDARNERRAARAQQVETVGESVVDFDLRQAVIHAAVLQRPYS